MFFSKFKKKSFFTSDIFANDKSISVGEFSYGNPLVRKFGNDACLVIGKYCSIADGVEIFLGGNHRTDWASTYPFPSLSNIWPTASEISGHPQNNGDVIIGNDVWIGSKVTIMSGAIIGDGAVIGAHTVITGVIQPYTIYAGNPARLIKRRFNEKITEKLIELKWWNLEKKEIEILIPYLCSKDIEILISKIEIIRG